MPIPRTPRALAVRILAVVLAVATVRLVATDLAALHRRTRDLGPLVDAVVASRALPAGTVLAAGDLATVERHASQLPPGALTDVGAAVDRTLVVPLLDGATVQSEALAPADRSGPSLLLEPGFRGVRVVTDDGLLAPVGSRVDVLAVVDPTLAPAGATSVAEATTVARAALVLAVDDPGDDDPSSVTDAVGTLLRVTEVEARRIAFAAASGVVVLALDPPEDACCEATAAARSPGR